MTDQNEYHLTEDELGMLQTFQEEVDEAQRQANALLTRIIKYRKLPNGMWARVGDKLIRHVPNQTEPSPLPAIAAPAVNGH